MSRFSRRELLQWTTSCAAAGAVLGEQRLQAQQQIPDPVPAAPIFPFTGRSPVALMKTGDRRTNVHQALLAIDAEILPKLQTKQSVVIKVNNVNTSIQLAATHIDALRGILDYLAPRFKGPVAIVESSAGDTLVGFESFKYADLIPEYKPLNISLVDLNREGKYEVFSIVDANIRPVAVRLAARLLDPDAFVISSAMTKTHNSVVATLSVKNMVIGTPLHGVGEGQNWSDKRLYHAQYTIPGAAAGPGGRGGRGWNPHAMNYNMAISARRLQPSWGVAVVDGFEGMEGNGPSNGDPVPLGIAIASPDFLAADRVGLETMGVPPHAVGYLQYAGQLGLGQYDLASIEVRGEKPESVRRQFKLSPTVDDQLRWLNPLVPQA